MSNVPIDIVETRTVLIPLVTHLERNPSGWTEIFRLIQWAKIENGTFSSNWHDFKKRSIAYVSGAAPPKKSEMTYLIFRTI
jgi:hypothetical protein